MQRRTFLHHTLITGTTAAIIPQALTGTTTGFSLERKFKISLNPGAIGASLDMKELLDMAIKYKYEAIVGDAKALAEFSTDQIKAYLEKMQANGVSWGSSGLPMEFRKSADQFRDDLKALPKLAAACQQAGITRMGTWVMPTHQTLTYHQNFKQHCERLQATANILGHHGIKLGLEYVGPKTLMTRNKFSFVRTMAECKELIAGIGESNVGFVLDSFHWYCAGDTVADLLTLDNEDIVTVDFNDARAGIDPDDQIDGKRELPGATGVIDMPAFIGALLQIGYDGPVRAEPFNQPLRDMEDEDAVRTTREAMRKVSGA